MVEVACSSCGEKHTADASCDPRIGTVLEAKYELQRVLGAGGMGKVYGARHKTIGRRLAVKFLLPQYATHKDVLRRFENEARTAGSLEHENIAAVVDFGRADDGAYFLVMEHLQGEDCEQLVSRVGPLPVPRAVDIIIQVCRGLDVAHQLAIVHRDLKPANLFLCKRADRTDLVKILDFGIAKLRVAAGETGAGASTGQTTGPIGTAYYMSPEQARGDKDLDHRSDVYALGVILYELLTAQRPHDGDSVLQIIHRILTASPPALDTLRPGLPPALGKIVHKAMAFAAADRFATVEELGEALRALAGPTEPIRSQPEPSELAAARTVAVIEVPPGATPASPKQPLVLTTNAPVTPHGNTPPVSSRRTVFAGAAVLAALLIGGAITFAVTRTSSQPFSGVVQGAAPASAASASAEPPASTPAASEARTAPSGQTGSTSGEVAQADGGSPDPVTKAAATAAAKVTPHPSATVVAAMKRGTTAAAAVLPPNPSCNPNYTLDANGDKHWKPECFPTDPKK